MSGSVSGGCVEDDLIARIKSGERSDKPAMIAYGVSKEEAEKVIMAARAHWFAEENN